MGEAARTVKVFPVPAGGEQPPLVDYYIIGGGGPSASEYHGTRDWPSCVHRLWLYIVPISSIGVIGASHVACEIPTFVNASIYLYLLLGPKTVNVLNSGRCVKKGPRGACGGACARCREITHHTRTNTQIALLANLRGTYRHTRHTTSCISSSPAAHCRTRAGPPPPCTAAVRSPVCRSRRSHARACLAAHT